MQIPQLWRRRKVILSALLALLSVLPVIAADTPLPELSRPARTWEFLSATGTRAGLFGNEAGNLEGWVYPLKVFRIFHVVFLIEGRELPSESLVRTVTVRPESTSILYSSDTFSVK